MAGLADSLLAHPVGFAPVLEDVPPYGSRCRGERFRMAPLANCQDVACRMDPQYSRYVILSWPCP